MLTSTMSHKFSLKLFVFAFTITYIKSSNHYFTNDVDSYKRAAAYQSVSADANTVKTCVKRLLKNN